MSRLVREMDKFSLNETGVDEMVDKKKVVVKKSAVKKGSGSGRSIPAKRKIKRPGDMTVAEKEAWRLSRQSHTMDGAKKKK